MSDQSDDSQKTEEPTAKKLADARKRGNLPRSMEVNTWLMLTAGTLIIAAMAPAVMRDVRDVAAVFVERPHDLPLDRVNLGRILLATVAEIATALAWPVLILFVAALTTGIVQNGFVFAPKAIEPKLEKLSPIAGAKRFVSARQWAEFVKGLLKIVIVGAVAVALMLPELARVDSFVGLEVESLLLLISELVLRLLVYVLAVLAAIAALDLAFQRMQHAKQLRMTKQEVKDEYKQAEGDPHVKGRLRQIRTERARQRMMQAVPEADVVVTNPTHFAIALKYQPDEMEAPVVVAKGQDFIAQKIREIAEEEAIPIIENKPLAQALYAGVDIGQEVPPEHYRTVAEVISYVWRLKGRAKTATVR